MISAGCCAESPLADGGNTSFSSQSSTCCCSRQSLCRGAGGGAASRCRGAGGSTGSLASQQRRPSSRSSCSSGSSRGGGGGREIGSLDYAEMIREGKYYLIAEPSLLCTGSGYLFRTIGTGTGVPVRSFQYFLDRNFLFKSSGFFFYLTEYLINMFSLIVDYSNFQKIVRLKWSWSQGTYRHLVSGTGTFQRAVYS